MRVKWHDMRVIAFSPLFTTFHLAPLLPLSHALQPSADRQTDPHNTSHGMRVIAFLPDPATTPLSHALQPSAGRQTPTARDDLKRHQLHGIYCFFRHFAHAAFCRTSALDGRPRGPTRTSRTNANDTQITPNISCCPTCMSGYSQIYAYALCYTTRTGI